MNEDGNQNSKVIRQYLVSALSPLFVPLVSKYRTWLWRCKGNQRIWQFCRSLTCVYSTHRTLHNYTIPFARGHEAWMEIPKKSFIHNKTNTLRLDGDYPCGTFRTRSDNTHTFEHEHACMHEEKMLRRLACGNVNVFTRRNQYTQAHIVPTIPFAIPSTNGRECLSSTWINSNHFTFGYFHKYHSHTRLYLPQSDVSMSFSVVDCFRRITSSHFPLSIVCPMVAVSPRWVR